MRKSIAFKLFLLTAGLSTTVIASMFIVQTAFLERFYVHQKVEDVNAALQSISQEWADVDDARTAFRSEQDFYQRHNTWIAALDAAGNLRHTSDFEVEVRLEERRQAAVAAENFTRALSDQTITIPLYTVMQVEELSTDNPLPSGTFISPGERIAIEGILIDNQLFPLRIGRGAAGLRGGNILENEQLANKEFEVVARFESPTEYHRRYPSVLVYGTVTQLRVPQGADALRYTNHLFLERLRAFQADLLYGDYDRHADTVRDVSVNEVAYKIFVKRMPDRNGDDMYLVAMTSLQPVNEAILVMRRFYGYIASGTLLLVLLASFYYSRRIARPLLQMNDAAQKMANLNFSVQVPVTTDDEIGNLSRNINQLAGLLHGHIVRLEQDIEKEKRLEQTRKEFIAGVSHELKTPLSVMEGCLYILKDKPDSQKREYYFAAMEDEVQRMNSLVTDMLELAKYESGTYVMDMTAFRLDSVLERACIRLAAEIARKRLHLHTHFLPAEVMAAPLRIEQVVVNLLTNAIRYTPEGNDIFITMTEGEASVTVSIENKGVRIPDEQIEKIWQRFYRGERSRHRATGGTGLGLAISKQILELHGVPYGARNTDDGVLFCFELNKAGQT